jgi:exoribonuclease II
MSHVVFEEDGGFKAGTVLTEAGGALQVEYASGKRGKIKASHVLMRFEQPGPQEVVRAAQSLADDIDLQFLWECAPQDEFDFDALAEDYFGAKPIASQRFGLLLRLHGAPVYFHRKGRGRYRPAPPDILTAALAALERKRLQEISIQQQAEQLVAQNLPEGWAALAAGMLMRPDKQSVAWRALELASERSGRNHQELLVEAGAFASARELHFGKFAAEHFPRGVAHTELGLDQVQALGDVGEHLPLAAVQAFSVDDSTTTEIDDALSVRALGPEHWEVGIHIAAPAVLIPLGSGLDQVGRARMSTVYMPGEKITMLPDALVQACSLDAGRTVPTLSLYLEVQGPGYAVVSTATRLERVTIAANLRHDLLDEAISEQALSGLTPRPGNAEIQPFWGALQVLWGLAQARTLEREKVRGKPEARFRSDFSFYIEDQPEVGEQVRIVQRRRDAPLDRIVAEMMILANSTWGKYLADHEVPGIYRSQQAGRVRTTTHPLPHAGLGVSQYIWSTSPLRRYVDLVNQRQIIAICTSSRAPYASNDSELFSVMSAFDAKYDAYADFQATMERYWCLRWLGQQTTDRVAAVSVREDLVRLADAPFYFRLSAMPEVAAGRRLWAQVIRRDEINVSLEARFIALDEAATSEVVEVAMGQAEPGDALSNEAPVSQSGEGDKP